MTIANLSQRQTLATLLQAMAPGAALAAGRTLEATLLSLDGDGLAIAQLGEVKVALVLAGPVARQAALQPGATLVLGFEAAEAPGQPLRATLLEVRPPSAQGPGQPQATEGQADTTVATGRPQPPATSVPPRLDETKARAQPGASDTLPPRMQAAASELPTARLQPVPGEGQPAAASTTASVAGSPRPAAAPALPVDQVSLQADQPARPVAALQEPASPRAAAGPLLGRAMAEQDSLAPLLANLRNLSQGKLAFTLPRALLQASDQVLAQALPVERQTLSGDMLKAAVQRSGLFLEARQAEGRPVPAPTDLKAGLMALRNALEPVIARLIEEPAPRAGTASQTTSAASTLPVPAAPDTLSQRTPPPPPRRDGLPALQPIAEPTLQPGEKPLVVAETLLRQTEAALDRVTLSQFASLPPDQPRVDMQGPRWLTELPLAMQAGIAMMPLQVEKEPPRQGTQEAQGAIWRVRFALDVEPMGPLQGVVTLQGRHVGVALWAVREETSRLLRQAAPGLQAALLDASFEDGEIEVHLGQPRATQPAAGQFLDRMS